MQTKRFTSLMLLTALSLLAGACAPSSSVDQTFDSMSGYNSGSAYTRTIFSTHNF